MKVVVGAVLVILGWGVFWHLAVRAIEHEQTIAERENRAWVRR